MLFSYEHATTVLLSSRFLFHSGHKLLARVGKVEKKKKIKIEFFVKAFSYQIIKGVVLNNKDTEIIFS